MNMEYQLLIPLDLHFFDEGEKTEQPSQRKKNKAREEGQVAKSQEIGTAFLFLVAFFSLRLFAGNVYESLQNLFIFEIGLIADMDRFFEPIYMSQHIAYLFGQVILSVLPIFAVVMVIGIVTNLLQVGWQVTTKPLQPKFSKLSPLKGVKRLFSMDILVNLVKSLLKFAVVGLVIYMVIQDNIMFIPTLLNLELNQAVVFMGDLIINMGMTVGGVYMFIAALDYAYTRYKHTKDLKMTKQEVKEEWKEMEGNPQVKGKIKQKMREVSMRRMMQNVPSADVIITNPTHYAVALRYDRLSSKAPVLVAKGMDFLAKRIKEQAKESGIEIVENPPLARQIYQTVDIDQEIPQELWAAVAEILAYVFKLKKVV